MVTVTQSFLFNHEYVCLAHRNMCSSYTKNIAIILNLTFNSGFNI